MIVVNSSGSSVTVDGAAVVDSTTFTVDEDALRVVEEEDSAIEVAVFFGVVARDVMTPQYPVAAHDRSAERNNIRKY
jgi:hypothetical protein